MKALSKKKVGHQIGSALIGSCTNSSYEDMSRSASHCKGCHQQRVEGR
jgi:aconitase A